MTIYLKHYYAGYWYTGPTHIRTGYHILRKVDSKSKLVLNASGISIKLIQAMQEWHNPQTQTLLSLVESGCVSTVRPRLPKIHCVEKLHMHNSAMSSPKLTINKT